MNEPDRAAADARRGAQLDPAFAEKWFNFVVAEVIHHHVILAGDQNAAPAADAATADAAGPGDANSGPAATSGAKPGPAHVPPKPPATAS